jgi:hypothetical protein
VSQLLDLVRPFPAKYVHTNPSGGGSYVKHAVMQQRLMQVLGPFTYEHVEVVRGDVDAIAPNNSGKSDRARRGAPALSNVIVGVIARLRVKVDGLEVIVEEAGDCEDPHNWPHDGARLKDATSDAFKRCSLRLGLGLHLWSGDDFFLFERLVSDADNAQSSRGKEPAASEGVPSGASKADATTPDGTAEAIERARYGG